jgi:hypothetical protein
MVCRRFVKKRPRKKAALCRGGLCLSPPTITATIRRRTMAYDTSTKSPRSNFQPARCPACQAPLTRNPTGRRKRYCSAACRLEGHRTIKNSISTRDEGLKRNGSKSPCAPGTFLLENRSRPSRGIVGPTHVIELEIGRAHAWTTEPNGAASTRLSPPALQRDRGGRQ